MFMETSEEIAINLIDYEASRKGVYNRILTRLGFPVREVELTYEMFIELYDEAVSECEFYIDTYNITNVKKTVKQHWVKSYTYALALVTIGNIRGKFSGLLGGENLDYNTLLRQGTDEISRLRGMLEMLQYHNQHDGEVQNYQAEAPIMAERNVGYPVNDETPF